MKKIYSKSKFIICLNVLLHYGGYRKIVGEQVKILKNNGLEKYNELIGEIGYVWSFEFENFEKPIIVHFPKIKKDYCFSIDELEIIGGKDEN